MRVAALPSAAEAKWPLRLMAISREHPSFLFILALNGIVVRPLHQCHTCINSACFCSEFPSVCAVMDGRRDIRSVRWLDKF